MYKCKYFNIKELVPPDVYEDRGEKAWELFDERILRIADMLRERFGPAIVNNWHVGGSYKESGLRVPSCKHYRPYSQHSGGRALDIKFIETSTTEVREYLRDSYQALCEGENRNRYSETYRPITIEENVSWLHVDVRQAEKRFNSF